MPNNFEGWRKKIEDGKNCFGRVAYIIWRWQIFCLDLANHFWRQENVWDGHNVFGFVTVLEDRKVAKKFGDGKHFGDIQKNLGHFRGIKIFRDGKFFGWLQNFRSYGVAKKIACWTEICKYLNAKPGNFFIEDMALISFKYLSLCSHGVGMDQQAVHCFFPLVSIGLASNITGTSTKQLLLV